MNVGDPHITRLLDAVQAGDRQAAEDLLPVLYAELRLLASEKLRHEKPGQTLDATALVHEAYVRLVASADERKWDSRGHFFAAAAEAMRRILVDKARRKLAVKHGGGLKREDIDEVEIAASQPHEDLLALDAALDKLAAKDAQKAELVKLRYFAGLTGGQAAEVLGISPATADRHWAYCKAWLHREIAGAGNANIVRHS